MSDNRTPKRTLGRPEEPHDADVGQHAAHDRERCRRLQRGHGSVVVTVIAMDMVEAVVDQEIGVVAMRNTFMAAIRAMPVGSIVPGRGHGVAVGVDSGDIHGMFDYGAIGPLVMQVPVMQVIDVTVMIDRGMSTTGTVNVRMVGVDQGISACAHSNSSFQ